MCVCVYVLGALRTRCELSLPQLCHLVDSSSPNSPLPVSQMTCGLGCEFLLHCRSHFATRKITETPVHSESLPLACPEGQTCFPTLVSKKLLSNLQIKEDLFPGQWQYQWFMTWWPRYQQSALGWWVHTWRHGTNCSEGSLCFTSCSKTNIPSAGSGWTPHIYSLLHPPFCRSQLQRERRGLYPKVCGCSRVMGMDLPRESAFQ